jgi:FkbM family methyltransferase
MKDFFYNLRLHLSQYDIFVRLAIFLKYQSERIIGHHLHHYGWDMYTNGEIDFAKQIAENSRCFVDVGGNVGDWAKEFLQAMTPAGKGLIFEPARPALQILTQQLSAYQNAEVVEAAVGAQSSVLKFYEEPDAGLTSSFVAEFSRADALVRDVKVTTLDAELAHRGWEHVDFLKIDTEGFDLNVLKGATELLSRKAFGVVQFEYNQPWLHAGATLSAAVKLLLDAGYKVFVLRPDGLTHFDAARYGEYFGYTNFVAIADWKMQDAQPFIKGAIE